MKRCVQIALLCLASTLHAAEWAAQENKPYHHLIAEIYSGVWAPAIAGQVNQTLGTTDWSYWPVGLKAGVVGRPSWIPQDFGSPQSLGLMLSVYGGGVAEISVQAVEAEVDVGLYEGQIVHLDEDPNSLSDEEIKARGGWTGHHQIYVPFVAGMDLTKVRSAGVDYNGSGGSVGSGLGARLIRESLVLDMEFFYRLGFGGEIQGDGDTRIFAAGKPITADTSGAAFTFGIGYAF
jgi:hypothetical protein